MSARKDGQIIDDETLLEEARLALSWAEVYWDRSVPDPEHLRDQAKVVLDKLRKRLGKGRLASPIIINAQTGELSVRREDR